MKSLRDLANSALWRCGYVLRPWQPYRVPRPAGCQHPYRERPEYGAANLALKHDRLQSGLPFEHPSIVNLNHAVARMIGDSRRIAELGAGTGTFALKVTEDATRVVVASELDTPTVEWCRSALPARPNLTFTDQPIPASFRPCDLVVSIEVIEHISDFVHFLREMTSLAPRALITTPNRARTADDWHSGPPRYDKHVREWTAGEFYWVLRCFWRDVELHAMKDSANTEVVCVDVDTHLSPLIADCRSPIC